MRDAMHESDLQFPLLVARYFDDALDEAGMRRFNELLREDSSRLLYLWVACRVARCRHDYGADSRPPVDADDSSAPRPDAAIIVAKPGMACLPAKSRYIGRAAAAWAIAAGLLAAAGILAALSGVFTSTPDADGVNPPSAMVATVTDTGRDSTLLVNDQVVSAGAEVRSGEVSLEGGWAEFRLHNGVGVQLRGDTQLRLDGEMVATMSRGSVTFDCPPQAKGYTVRLASGVQIVDLGTRFRVEVRPDGQAITRVLVGRVRVEPPAGSAVTLAAGSGVSISAAGSMIAPLADLDPSLELSNPQRDDRWRLMLADLADSPDAFFVAPLDADAAPLVGRAAVKTVGVVTPAPNRFGRPDAALHFDGAPAYVQYPMTWPDGDYTAAAWVRLTEWRPRNYILAVQLNTPDHLSHQLKLRQSLATIEAYETASPHPGVAHRAAGPAPQLGRWTHLAATHRAVDADTFELTVYVDGVPFESTRYTRPPGVAIPANLTLGGRPNLPARTDAFVGDIDDVLLLRRAMTGDEIDDLYRLSRPDGHAPAEPSEQKETTRIETQEGDKP